MPPERDYTADLPQNDRKAAFGVDPVKTHLNAGQTNPQRITWNPSKLTVTDANST